MLNEYLAANRDHWDELVPVHAKSDFYDVEGFQAGGTSLYSVELERLGDVRGVSLLHLQCHFGLDTLSWARLGATATGVDFSPKAIAVARNLSAQSGVEARFIESNIYDLPDVLDERFDVVFTSYGVLTHLPDMSGWADVVARFLKPGGAFHMVEFHPFASVFSDDSDAIELRPHYPYFDTGTPLRFDPTGEGSYADSSAVATGPSYEWSHSLSEILGSLLRSGLRMEEFHEFDFSVYRQFPFLERSSDGLWRLPPGFGDIPLMFSVKAIKPV